MFTGNIDLDLEIMNHLEIYDIERLCKTRHNDLCNQKHFWLNKISKERLSLPIKATTVASIRDSDKSPSTDGSTIINIIEDDINWLKVYKSLKKVDDFLQYMNKYNHRFNSLDVNAKYNMNYFGTLFNKYAPFTWDEKYHIYSIGALLNKDKVEIIIGILSEGWAISDELEVSFEDFKNMLFKMFYDNAVRLSK